MPEPRMSAKKYRAVRKELGLTQQELADKLGLTPRTIQLRENARKVVTGEAVCALKYVVLESMYDMAGVFDEW